jgi:tRNA 2-thiouridine synthesizing protein B
VSTLHIVSKSPYGNSALADCLRVCGAASLLLTEDAVSAALIDSEWANALQRDDLAVYVLMPDCIARGFADRISPHITAIDYAGFVQLCCDHEHPVSWY